MKDRTLQYAGLSASLLSICVIGLAMLSKSNSQSDYSIIAFMLWGISPYGILIIGHFIIRKIAIIPAITKIFCAASILLLVLTIYVCYATLTSRSSTAGLAFVFFPLYLNGLVILLIVGGLIWTAVAEKIKSNGK